MSIAIAIIYSAAAFAGIILWLRSQPPTGDFLIAGIAGVGVIIRRNIPHPSNNRRNYRSNPTWETYNATIAPVVAVNSL
jgi:hypothetical protein